RFRDRNGLAVDLVRRPGVVVKDEARADDLTARPADRLSDVPAFEPSEFLAVLLDQVGELGERPAALAGRPIRPALAIVERLAGRDDRSIDVLAAAERGAGNDLAGRRVHDLEGLAVRGIDGLAAD